MGVKSKFDLTFEATRAIYGKALLVGVARCESVEACGETCVVGGEWKAWSDRASKATHASYGNALLVGATWKCGKCEQ